MTKSEIEYGIPHPKAATWVWEEYTGHNNLGNVTPTGVVAESRGSTEMEALDRLRADNPKIGSVRLQSRR